MSNYPTAKATPEGKARTLTHKLARKAKYHTYPSHGLGKGMAKG